MNKLYNLLCGMLLIFLMIMGCISLFDKDATFSEHEQRELRTFPQVSFTALFNGEFTAQLEEYYADTFPGREGMVEKDGLYDFFFGFTGQVEEAEETEPEV